MTSSDQSIDVRIYIWRPLDILGTSGMSCKRQILIKPAPCEMTSPGRPGDVSECNSDVCGMSLWRPNLCQILTSRERKKLFTKWGKYDVIIWHCTDQNLTSWELPIDVRVCCWRPLDILWTSEMSCKCHILTKLELCGWTSPGRPGDVSDSCPMNFSPDVHRTSPWCPNLRQILTSRGQKNLFTKWGKYDVIIWRRTDQNPTSW